jgi:chemotaxis protein CheD
MKTHVLNIGEVKIEDSPATFTCFGLGSCIGLFMQDRATGISGGAHILLPEDEQVSVADDKCYNVKQAMNTLLEQFKMRGSKLDNLRAKFVGGASVIPAGGCVGDRNVRSVINHLIAHRVFIAALDVGGCSSRTVHFDSQTCELRVRTAENNSYRIY